MKKFIQFINQNCKLIRNICDITQIACFFYAFLCILYWFITLLKLPLATYIGFLFTPVFNFVKLFYEQKTISTAEADLSGIIAGLLFAGLAILAHAIRERVEYQEQLLRIQLEEKKKADDLMAQRLIQKEYIEAMKKYNKFIVLVNFNVQQIKSFLTYNTVDENELLQIKNTITGELFNAIDGDYLTKKEHYENNSFYIIGNLENTPECIHRITQTIKDLSKKYGNMDITLTHDLSFDAISTDSNIEEKLEFLKKILQLNYNNASLTTALFKTCFELISKTRMNFRVLGKFQFLINDKSSNYELYSVKIN